jgi:tRNA U34 5-carboxymethylaminomethyl modifying GTPase MnmE/TrmE
LKIQHSFFSLLLINPFEMRDDFVELTKIHFDGIYFTHQDLPGFDQARQAVIDQFPSLTSAGSINLKILHSNFEMDMIEAVNKKYLLAVSAGPLLLDRHKHLITEIARHLDKYQFLCQAESDVGILSHELNTLASCLSELLGIVSPDQVLNSIFSNFCIGK